MRRVANAMIIMALLGLLGIVLYFVGTCAYTARQQDSLRNQLAVDNPALATAEQTVSEEDFITLATLVGGAANAAAQSAAEAERLSKLTGLKAAADAYMEQIRGHVGKAIGRIVIPNIGVDVVMVEGNFEDYSDSYLRKGPGRWPETRLPGQGGAVVVSGHRTTYGAPFRKLNELKAGDEIQLVMPYAIVRYTVTEVIIVQPDEVEAVADRGKEQVSLVACHPISYARQRIVVKGDLSSFVQLGAGQ
jgi:LPXTG-site transpeptidase (sortase) family protein